MLASSLLSSGRPRDAQALAPHYPTSQEPQCAQTCGLLTAPNARSAPPQQAAAHPLQLLGRRLSAHEVAALLLPLQGHQPASEPSEEPLDAHSRSGSPLELCLPRLCSSDAMASSWHGLQQAHDDPQEQETESHPPPASSPRGPRSLAPLMTAPKSLQGDCSLLAQAPLLGSKELAALLASCQRSSAADGLQVLPPDSLDAHHSKDTAPLRASLYASKLGMQAAASAPPLNSPRNAQSHASAGCPQCSELHAPFAMLPRQKAAREALQLNRGSSALGLPSPGHERAPGQPDTIAQMPPLRSRDSPEQVRCSNNADDALCAAHLHRRLRVRPPPPQCRRSRSLDDALRDRIQRLETLLQSKRAHARVATSAVSAATLPGYPSHVGANITLQAGQAALSFLQLLPELHRAGDAGAGPLTCCLCWPRCVRPFRCR